MLFAPPSLGRILPPPRRSGSLLVAATASVHLCRPPMLCRVLRCFCIAVRCLPAVRVAGTAAVCGSFPLPLGHFQPLLLLPQQLCLEALALRHKRRFL